MASTPPPKRPRGKGEGKLSLRRLNAADRQAQALDLATQGLTWDEIAREVGYANKGGAYKAAMSALKRVPEPAAEEYRRIQSLRLDAFLAAVWTKAMSGDPRAIEVGLKIEERRARLFDLDLQPAPLADQVGASTINALILQIVRDPELAEIADQLAARLSHAGGNPLEPAPPGSPPLAGLLASRTPS